MHNAVAVVGASPNSPFSNWAMKNLRQFDPDIEVWPVTSRHDVVRGHAAFPSVNDLPGDPTAAIVAVRRSHTIGVVKELTERRVRDIVVVSAGFSERGDEQGTTLATEFREIVQPGDSRIWGPNCIGFADFRRRICAIAEPVPKDVQRGNVSIISQSGALLSNLMAAFTEESLGVDWCVSTGNGTFLGVGEAIETAVDRPNTDVICVYIEGVPSAAGASALERALSWASQAGKTLIVLKGGASDRGQRAVLSHTASIAGADSVFTGLLRQYDAIRVHSASELVRTARIAVMGPKRSGRGGVAVLGRSGGGAALASDLAETTVTRLARFSSTTVQRLKEISGPGSFIENPLDILRARSEVHDEGEVGTVSADGDVGFVLMAWPVKFPDDSAEEYMHRDTFEDLARTAGRTGVPTAIVSISSTPETDWLKAYQARNPEVAVLGDLALTFSALAHFFPENSGRASDGGTVPGGDGEAGEVLDEWRSRELLAAAGVRLAKGALVPSADGAIEATSSLQPPFAVKIVASISHKSSFGGVTLGAASPADAARAISDMERAVQERGLTADQIKGYLIAEMVFGREVLVGLNVDDVWGKYVTIGLGGVAAELAGKAVTRRLPVTTAELEEMLSAVDVENRDDVVSFVANIVRQFDDGQLMSAKTVELNPVVITRDSCYAVDAVVVQPGSRDQLMDEAGT